MDLILDLDACSLVSKAQNRYMQGKEGNKKTAKLNGLQFRYNRLSIAYC